MLFEASCLGLPSTVLAAQITLEPVADTEMREGTPQAVVVTDTIVAGALGDFAGKEIRRGLLRFDLTAIPASAVIRDARLTLAVVRVPQNPGNSTFELRRVLRSWHESEATWNGPTNGSTWQVPGALGAQDVASVVAGTASLPGLGPMVFGDSTNLVADIQGWLRAPAANHGWLLRSQDEATLRTARHFAAREQLNPAVRPRLTIEYTVPPALEHLAIEGGDIVFDFLALAGLIYRLEQRNSFTEGGWDEVRSIGPFAADQSVTVREPVGSSEGSRFFQVKLE